MGGSQGRLYRSQTAALALSTVPPVGAGLAWFVGVGPSPPLNFTVTAFVAHLALDYYAFFRRDMLDLPPATRRVAERSALDELATPVFVLDETGRVVEYNDAAGDAFGASEGALGAPLGTVLGADVDLDVEFDPDAASGPHTDPGAGTAVGVDGDGTRPPDGGRGGDRGADSATGPPAGDYDDVVTVRTDDGRREFAVSVSPVADAGGDRVGYTVVVQDVTERNRRRQRLAVLSRVLRHNLRNDLTVVTAHADAIRDRTDDPEVDRSAAVVAEQSRDLADLGDRARRFQRTIDRAGETTDRVELGALARGVVADCREGDAGPGADGDPGGDGEDEGEGGGGDGSEGDGEDGPTRPTVEVTADGVVETDPEVLGLALSALVENALEHADSRVVVSTAGADPAAGTVTLAVADDGPGIPEYELSALREGGEGALEHGSGLGLWVARWSARALGGSLSFETGDGTGTTVRLAVPGLVAAAPDGHEPEGAGAGTGTAEADGGRGGGDGRHDADGAGVADGDRPGGG